MSGRITLYLRRRRAAPHGRTNTDLHQQTEKSGPCPRAKPGTCHPAKTASSRPIRLSDLPPEVILLIFESACDFCTAIVLQATCRRFHLIWKDNIVSITKYFLRRDMTCLNEATEFAEFTWLTKLRRSPNYTNYAKEVVVFRMFMWQQARVYELRSLMQQMEPSGFGIADVGHPQHEKILRDNFPEQVDAMHFSSLYGAMMVVFAPDYKNEREITGGGGHQVFFVPRRLWKNTSLEQFVRTMIYLHCFVFCWFSEEWATEYPELIEGGQILDLLGSWSIEFLQSLLFLRRIFWRLVQEFSSKEGLMHGEVFDLDMSKQRGAERQDSSGKRGTKKLSPSKERKAKKVQEFYAKSFDELIEQHLETLVEDERWKFSEDDLFES